MQGRNKADILGQAIFDAVMEEHKRLGLVVINRGVSFDFARVFKETSMDYTSDCVLVERCYLKSACELSEKMIQRLPEGADDLKNDIFALAYELSNPDLTKEEQEQKMTKAVELEKQLSELELVETPTKILTYDPFVGEDNHVIVLDLEDPDVSKDQYLSFCNQMAYMAFNYFSAMVITPPSVLNLEVLVIRGTSYIDILCQVKN